MSISAVRRSFRAILFVKTHCEARFGELADHLAPISHTALSHLLASLVEIGELAHRGRRYTLGSKSIALMGPQRGIYSLPTDLSTETNRILEQTALDTMHSCGLFGWVGISTMRILDICNLENADWTFNPVGYEWPLIPFHGFAQLFLAFAPETLARDCFYRWHTYLQGNLRFSSYGEFQKRLGRIRHDRYAVEYRGERATILRIGVPVNLPGQPAPRYVVGLSANAIHILEAERGVAHLQSAAKKLAAVLNGRVPIFHFEEQEELMRVKAKELGRR